MHPAGTIGLVENDVGGKTSAGLPQHEFRAQHLGLFGQFTVEALQDVPDGECS
jgi:hypothetical protein